ncbi:MAG: histidine--tRNA ligase [Candidatus Saccharibacteria bacterium]
MSKTIPQLLKGFRDYLPQEQIARRKMILKISEIFERFGFAPIDTPALESFALLKGKLGEEERLIYKFKDLGDREVALRYDLTVPLARVYSSYPDLPKPFKRYQIAPVYRAENPQRGRFRELVQCDVDIVGSESPLADAEVIATLYTAFKALEVGEVVVRLNNRRLIDETLTLLKVSKSRIGNFMRMVDKMDKIGEQEVIRALEDDGFDSHLLNQYSEYMEQLGERYVREMREMLSCLGVENVTFDKYLVRGLDYYTGTIFEFGLKDKPEFGSIAGGGRYDNLIGKISGTDTPAVGGSIGLDRLFAALQDRGVIAPQTAAEVIILNLDAKLLPEYLKMATVLRREGLDTELFYETAKFTRQFKYAEAKNMKLAVVYGSDEAKQGKVSIRNLEEKRQVTVDSDELVTTVKSMLW